MVAPLLALSLFLGLYPKPVLDRIEPTVKAKIARLEEKTDYREPEPPKFLDNVRNAADGDDGGSK